MGHPILNPPRTDRKRRIPIPYNLTGIIRVEDPEFAITGAEAPSALVYQERHCTAACYYTVASRVHVLVRASVR